MEDKDSMSIRKFKYFDQDGEHELDEQQIIDTYFSHWCKLMKKTGKEHMISRELCIEDFCVIHWAWEVE